MIQNWTGRPKGLIRDAQDSRDYPFEHVARLLLRRAGVEHVPPRASVIPYCSLVRDQGALGSCSAFAAVVGLREQLDILHERDPFVPLSPLFEYFTTRSKPPYFVDQDTGATIRDAMDSMAIHGVCPESEWPYDVDRFSEFPESAQDTERFRIHAYYRVKNLAGLKASIAAKHGVVGGISIYESFEAPETMRTGRVPFPAMQSEEYQGGHAIFFVAYDDDERVVTFKNSWGMDCGVDGTGYFELPYEYFDPKFSLFWDGWTATV